MKLYCLKYQLLLCILLYGAVCAVAQTGRVTTSTIGLGWANNSVNTVIFRKNSLITFKGEQYAAYYNNDQVLVLAKRKSNSTNWQVATTRYKADAADAHKDISIMVDGAGYLHVAWGHHNQALNYAKSIKPGSLILSDPQSMTGVGENKVSYPEFYRLRGGDLLFVYRDGGSGNGNLVMNRYSIATQKWVNIQQNLIDGEGKRNAYWQMCIDKKGTIHISWVWRETPDVASNHDMCYARSNDGGLTWEKSTGEKYLLPINAANAEYACRIPQHSELINQTSMFADDGGNPFIATYWRDSSSTAPQYHIVFKTSSGWHSANLGFRKTAFSLGGTGTKRIPISRPQIITWNNGGMQSAALIFRDAERGDKVSVAMNADLKTSNWQVSDLTTTPVGEWEPTYDTELWKDKKILNLFVQQVTQVDGEGKASIPPTNVQVLEWMP
ncbi:BNR repeat-containing protein [Mucilaginibacter gossypii]|uniref:BNR repeat-containing protein n=1 Tax=Mucilaginibacter gossypii TaxID=551996 RepID=UPI000DCDA45C|nr:MULTISPECIES: BNR repeat-containing protein [Mucilaginibacter]QTE39614.1 BNR repeat-containing protein [Mucilaginibacter gossypii]RAV53992.1 neuraminidase [Mucilaginibacter rubeus]